MKNLKIQAKDVYKLIAVYFKKNTQISAVINFILFFFNSILLRIMLFDMVPSLLLLDNWKPRYESLCSYTPLIFLYFLFISHVFINIHHSNGGLMMFLC